MLLAVSEVGTCSTCFEFYFGRKNPFGSNLIFALKDEARNGNLVVVDLCIAYAIAIEAVQSVIFEGGKHLTVASDAPFFIVVAVTLFGLSGFWRCLIACCCILN